MAVNSQFNMICRELIEYGITQHEAQVRSEILNLMRGDESVYNIPVKHDAGLVISLLLVFFLISGCG